MRPSLGRRIFEAFNYAFFILLSLACIFPVIHVLALSFSTSTSAAAGKVVLWPVDFTTEAYRYTLSKREVFSAMGISFQRTLLGTAINLVLTIFAAYPLSKEKIEFRSRIIYVWYFVITILFSGGDDSLLHYHERVGVVKQPVGVDFAWRGIGVFGGGTAQLFQGIAQRYGGIGICGRRGAYAGTLAVVCAAFHAFLDHVDIAQRSGALEQLV